MRKRVRRGDRAERGKRAAHSPGTIQLSYSPCPNDTFIFHAWVSGGIPDAPPVKETLLDIDKLNQLALAERADVVKVSFHAIGYLLDRYALLHSGGALGRGCGPLLVAREGSDVSVARLKDIRVAIPGELTTAALLLRLMAPGRLQTVTMPFDEIMPAVSAGRVEAGVIIHEGRFTYPDFGLVCLCDLGDWWEATTGHPIPLGGIAVRRSLGVETAERVDRTVRASVEQAWKDPEASRAYVDRHAQEMDPKVCREHIALYVNEFTVDYGEEGEEAIRQLLRRVGRAGIIPGADLHTGGIFWDDNAL